MSELINNLNAIYNTKLQIKEVIGTSSDNFSEYPTLIDEAISSGSAETIAQKNAAWQTKWAPALAQVAAGLYQQDPTYGEPMITEASGWCVQTALDGNAAMSEMIAMNSLWLEIYTDNNTSSMVHEQYVQIFNQMGLTVVDGYLVSTDDDKIIPFDIDEAIITNLTGIWGLGVMGGKRINSLNGNVLNSKWDYYGLTFNGTRFDYVYCGQYDHVVNQILMIDKMQADGVTFINYIPAVNLATLQGYLTDFQIDGTVNPTGSLSITSNNTYDVTDKASVVVNVPTGGVEYTFVPNPADVTSGSIDVNSYYLFVGTVSQSMDVDSEIAQAVPEASIGDHIITLDSSAHAVVIIPSQIIDSRTWAADDKVLVKGKCVSTTSVWSGNMYTADEVDNITI